VLLVSLSLDPGAKEIRARPRALSFDGETMCRGGVSEWRLTPGALAGVVARTGERVWLVDNDRCGACRDGERWVESRVQEYKSLE
jgi:hypothetical protein